MSDFTPGPWSINKYGSVGAGQFGTLPIIAVIEPLFGADARFGDHNANARLIAAAPEMYEALKGAHAAIDMLYARLIAVEELRFLPSKDPTWPKMVAVFDAIKKVDGDA